KDVLLLDVTPLSLGIETLGNVFTKIIERNTTIPTKKSQVFSTAADNQTAVDIHVLQGERSMAYDNTTLGRFQLSEIPPAPRGIPQIEVTFDIDSNGIVNVSAKDLGTGKEQKVTITSGTNLTEEEIERKVKEAEMNAEADKQKKEKIEALNQAESTIYQTEKTLNELGDKVSADDKSAIEGALANLKSVKDKQDATASEIKTAIDEVMNKFHKISEQMYQQAQAQQQAQGGAGDAGYDQGASQGNDDNVVDADFTEVDDK
ncbi:MAG: Hsp70 family protein, partial [Intestinibacter sp.]|uniref:Hsp70 family protein n=1 Tax=Intestinibacter sp. TaxID=1965304 RepID=UPI003F17C01A